MKPPPVLAKKINNIGAFPLDFQLTSELDSLPEVSSEWKLGQQGLIISARLDSDGIANTRSPDDLVGQGKSTFQNGQWSDVAITLQGRGIGGKLITTKR